MKPKQFITLLLVFIFGFILRFYQLGTLPNAYTPDEVAQGYSAYSFLETHKDEWSNSNPFLLQSFGDYKLPLQTWLMMPSVYFFGLTPFAIRLPNALLSALAIVTIYLFTTKFTNNRIIALIAATLLAVSPWHLPMSRIALEANLTVFLISFASWIFLTSSKNPLLQILSAVIFALNMLSYHSAKLFTPIWVILLFLFIYNFRVNLSHFKKYSLFIVIFPLPLGSIKIGERILKHNFG